MPDFNFYMSDLGSGKDWTDDIDGAYISQNFTERIIKDKPVTIVIVRNTTQLDPQTVRIEMTRIAPDINVGQGAREPRGNAILIGYKDHPTISDTDILPGDRFIAYDLRYEARYILPATEGNIQVWIEVVE